MRVLVFVLVVGWSRLVMAESIELLHNVPSQIAVSSQVESATIKPEQLVDRDRTTAWNSKTDDLVGAWIEFRVSNVVTVDEIKLIVGHTGKGPEGDYFPMNHRIKRMRVMRDGTKLGDYTLDPNNRELQAIKIGKPGGVYRLQVLEVVRGTKRNWRELCVAELEVWGTLPADMTAVEHDPATYWSFAVGKLPPPTVLGTHDPRPEKTWAARCQQNLCKGSDPAKAGPFAIHPAGSKLQTVFVEVLPGYSYARIFLETAAGWYYGGSLGLASYGTATKTATIDELSVKDNVARIQIDLHGDDGASHGRFFQTCGLAADGAPTCLAESIGVDVDDRKMGNEYHHVVRVDGRMLKIGRAPKGSWDWIVGDHPLPWTIP